MKAGETTVTHPGHIRFKPPIPNQAERPMSTRNARKKRIPQTNFRREVVAMQSQRVKCLKWFFMQLWYARVAGLTLLWKHEETIVQTFM